VAEQLWHIGDVARLSGVSSRALRHYDEIGLLRPKQADRDGTRYYDRAALVRLQRILLLRELGMGLAEIRRVVDGETDELGSLTRHREALANDLQRRTRLLATIDATLATLTEGSTVNPEQLFDGFDAQQQAGWEADLVERYGDDGRSRLAESRRQMATWQRADADAAREGFEQVELNLAELLVAGAGVDDPRVQAVIATHYAVVCRFWTPDADSYAGLADMYVEHPDFRTRYESRQPGLAEYLRAAMRCFAAAMND
jgi:MerR family transcriptional regulator, thiopeptide resistance regulator